MKTEKCISRNQGLFSLLLALMMLIMSASAFKVNAQTITTDKVDYMPGDTVTVSGTGWRANEPVGLLLTELELLDPAWSDIKKTVVCDSYGNFTDQIYIVVTANLGAFFHITATGEVSQHVSTITFNDAGGDYAIDFSAYDPEQYLRKTPGSVAIPSGRIAGSTLGQTNHSQTVESLMPAHLGLGQIVAFEFFIRVDHSTSCPDDKIQFTARFNTKTSSGKAFGYDPAYMVYAAFVDAAAGGGIIDPDGDATISGFTAVNFPSSGYFEGTITVENLDEGDEIPVEVWVVLKPTIPADANGNVPSSLRSASTAGTCQGGQNICTGNQTVPLNHVSEFFTSCVDVAITKTDTPDPVVSGNQLVYTISLHNSGPSVANNVIATDILDNNTTYYAHNINDNTGTTTWQFIQSGQNLTFSTAYLNAGETVTITLTVTVQSTAPHTGSGGPGGPGNCNTGDIRNPVSVTTISQDNNLVNNSYCQPTGVTCPAIAVTCPPNQNLEGCSVRAISGLEYSETPVAITVAQFLSAGGTVTNPSAIVSISYQDVETGACPIVVTRTFTLTDICQTPHVCQQTINVDDNNPPVVTVPSAALSMECFNANTLAAWASTASAVDVCSGAAVVSFTYTPPSDNCNKNVAVTFTATDACGNIGTATKAFLVNDVTPPVITGCPTAPINLGCNPSSWPEGNATATDNCGTPTITSVLGDPISGQGCAWSRIRTYTATDGCGNTAICTQTYNYSVDVTPPVFTFCPPGNDLGCNPAGIPAPGNATATDNCGTPTITSVLGDPVPVPLLLCPTNCTWTRTRTYTATDACGNTATCTQVFTYTVDVTPPVFTSCPHGSYLGCNPNGFPPPGNAVATDNCGTPTITSVLGAPVAGQGCTWTRTRTYTATDGCGNTATCTQVFTYKVDVTPPVFTFCPPGTDLGCNPKGCPPPGNAVATDNCGTPTINSVLGAPVAGQGCTWTRTRTYTATDVCGNTATCTQVFTYKLDVTPPVFTFCPPGSDLGCNPVVFPAPGNATATDNCGTPTITSVLGGPVPMLLCPTNCTWTRTRTYTATDACGNTATCTQVFTYTVDVTPPVFTSCPQGSNLGCNPTGFPAPGNAVATDNCGTPTITSVLGAPVAGQGCTWTRTRTYTATDGCGNTATCTQTYSYTIDQTPPVISGCPTAPIALGCNPTPPTCDDALARVTASDVCSGTITPTCTAGAVTVDGCLRSQVFTLTATDACNNSSTCTVTYTWTVDQTPPVISGCPTAPIALGCNPTPPTCDDALARVTASDVCSGTITPTCTAGAVTVDGCLRSQVFTLTATDACNNSSTCTVTYTWTVDQTPPVISGCPTAPIALGCNPTPPTCDDALARVTASDVCSGTITPTCTAGTVTVDGCLRSQVFTLTATDACNNSSTCTVTYTWTVDQTPPVISGCPTAPIALGCNPTPPTCDDALARVTASDVCSGTITPTCTAGTVTVDGCLRSQVFTLTATDACNNSSTCTVTYTWTVDQTPPVISGCPTAPIALGCNPTPPTCDDALARVTASDVCSGTITPTCTAGTVTVDGCLRSQVFTLTATDACNNSSTCTVTYTWTVDQTPPVISGCPTAPIALGCNPTPPTCDDALARVTASDVCSGTITPTCTAGTVTVDGCLRSQVFTLTATDACNNSSTCTVTYTWTVDQTPPVISGCPTAPIALGCNPTPPTCDDALARVTASDVCSGTITPTCTAGAVTVDGCLRSQVFTLTATDACNNSSTCTVTYTWTVDQTPPVISGCPTAPIALGCNPTPPTCDDALARVTASDVCSGTITPTCTAGTVTVDGCLRSQVFTLTATDACNNSSTCTVTYTWTVDQTPPVISGCPTAPIALGCNPTPPTCDDALARVTASDVCSGTITPTCTAGTVTVDGCLRSQVFTLTATDACNNSSTCTVTYTWTVDQTPPVISGCPTAPIALGCNPTPPTCDDALARVTASDVCSGTITPTCTAGTVTVDGCLRSQVFTLTATDACNNSSTCTVTYTWTVDQTPPVISGCPTAPIALGCNPTPPTCDDALARVTASDVCSGTITPTCTAGTVTVDGCLRSQVFTLTATDACNNSSTCTVTYTWTVDQTPPVISGCPTAPIALGCNPTPPTCDDALARVTASDVCSGTITPTCTAGTVTVDGCLRSQVFTLTATDACNNSSTCTVTYTWTVDQTPPVISGCPTAPIALGCNPTPPTCDDALALVTASDICSGTITPTCTAGTVTVDGCLRSQVFTLTATDACNNSSTCTVTYTWTVDATPPVFTNCPPTANQGCNPSSWPEGNATATDNCGTPAITSVLGNPIAGQGCVWSRIRTYTATDGCGNTATCTQTYNYTVDLIPPVFTVCPPTANQGCNPSSWPEGNATATDNCGTPAITSVLGNPIAGQGCAWSRIRTYTATDGCGNTATCTQTYNYTVDVTPPVFTFCPPGSDLGCNPAGIPAPGNATATDNCGTPTITSVLGDPVPMLLCPTNCTWTRTRTYTATDGCGNTATCTQVFTYTLDVTPPVFTSCPHGSNLGCNPTGFPPPGNAEATDNCGTPTITSVLGAPVAGQGCTWTRTRTYTATDVCGNTATCKQVFTYKVDITPPVFTFCPPGIDLGCNPTGCPPPGNAVATDNCGTPTITSVLGTPVAGQGCTWTRTRTYTATDVCGNTATCTQVFTYKLDVTPPVFTFCPPGSDLGCNPAGFPAPGNATATDNCGTPTITSVLGDPVPMLLCPTNCTWTRTRTYTATDACGNTATCTQVFTYTVDVTPPVFTSCPQGSNLGCNPTGFPAPGNAVATDNCGTPTITSVLGAPVAGQGCTWTRTRTYTATDGCGNTATCTQTYSYTIDQTPPVISGCPTTPIALGCNPTAPTCDDALARVTASDVCSGTITPTCTAGMVTADGCLRSQVFTLTATDACNNSSTCTVTYTWTVDQTPPVISGCPTAPIALGCNPTPPTCDDALARVTASDVCSGTITPTCTAGTVTVDGCLRSQVFTLTATDACNNSSTCTVTYTWTVDQTPPVISGCPTAPIALGCNPTPPTCDDALALVTASDICSGTITPTCTAGTVTVDGCLRSQVFTLTATDACNNSSTCTVTYTWTVDQTPPVISGCPTAPIALGCNPTPPTCDDALALVTASDICSGTITPTCTAGTVTVDGCLRSQVFTLTATDACNNSSTCTVTYTWTVDQTPPVISGCPTAPIALGCNPTPPTCDDALARVTASDVCSGTITPTCTAGTVTVDGCLRSQVFTLTATDACNNSSTCTVTYTWTVDQTPPVISGCPTAPIALGCNPTPPTCDDALALVTASDICSGTITPTCTAGTVTVDGCLRSQVFTLTATDACNNSSTCTVTYTWTVDQTPPVISGCPTAPIALGCNPTPPTCDDALARVTASDVCSGTITPTCTAGTVTVDGCLRSQVFTLTATDACNNSSTCTVTYTWTVDQTPPVISGCPTAPIALGCNPTPPTCDDALARVTASDVCSGTITPTCTAGTVTVDGCLRSQVFNLTATDACNNSSTCTVTYTWIVDQTPPVISGCPTAPIALGCNPTPPTCDDALARVTASDVCSGTITPTCTAGTVTVDGCLRSQVFTLTATDACNNSSTCTVTYTWTVDQTPPVISGCPTAPIALGCNPTPPTCDDALARVTASDVCSGTITPTCSAGTVTVDGCLRSQVFTLTATDACNNSSTCTVTYTWTVDQTPPVISGCPTAPIALGCNPTPPTCDDALARVTASDVCSGTITPTCTAGTVTVDGCLRSQVFTLTATDACNNSSTCTVTYTWTVDQTPPVISGCPTAPIALGCNPTPPTCDDALARVTASDVCSGTITPTCSAGTVTVDGCLRSQVFTLTATDACNNSSSCTVTYTWTVDQTPPVISGCPTAPIALGCNPTPPTCDDALARVTASDVCSGTITPTCSAGTVTVDGCLRSQVFTLTATDACNNSSTCTVTYTWTVDATPPVFTNCPPTANQGCNPSSWPEGNATATDNCGTPAITSVLGDPIAGQGCTWSRIRTYTATDGCGNTATCTQTYNYTVDLIPPVFTVCPPTANQGCNPSSWPEGNATATDNCGTPAITSVLGNPIAGQGCAWSRIRTYTATDGCGNTATCTQTYNYTVDVTPPVFTFCPPGSDLGCNPAGIPAPGNATATDNCGTPTITSVLGDPVPMLLCPTNCTWTRTRTYTATDGCGNTATCTQVFTYTLDVTPPVFTSCPHGSNLGCNPTGFPPPGNAEATDNCGTPTITSVLGAPVAGQGCTWTRTRTYTATDGCGNTATCKQVFTYKVDITPPVFTFCPPGIDLGCNPTGCPPPGNAVATDNCGTPTITSVLGTPVAGQGCTWTRTRTYTATDVCGNTATCTQVFTYKLDVTPPVFTFCPPGSDLGCNPAGFPAPGNATATDNCGTPTITSVLGDPVPMLLCPTNCTWTRTRTYTATDACGNTATCTQVFTYTVDVTPPVFTSCPQGSNLGCNPTGFPAPGNAVATDNCGTPTITSVLGAPVAGQGCTWTRTRTYTATDGCGNTSTCAQVFTYKLDVTPPVFTFCPPGSDLGCNPNGVPDPGTPTATDNCAGTVTFSNSLAAEVPGAGCTWSRTRTYTATDACGNTATCTQVFTYTRDLVAPVFTFCPPGSDLGCNPNGVPDPGTPTATDNCAGTVTFSSSLAAEVPGAGCTWSRTRTYTATDACGNTATCTQVFTYTRDLVAPVFTFCPPGSDLGCNPNGVPDPGTPTATDNCAGTVTFSNSLAAEVPGAGCTWSRTRTYTATDACGNTATCTQVFTYTRDLVAPVFTFCPPGSDLGCNPNGVPDPGTPTATDNCAGTVTFSNSLAAEVPGAGCTWSRTRTYTATDACGNTATCTQVFTYTRDLVAPVFTFCPPGSDLGCNPNGVPDPGTPTATDNCAGTVTFSNSLAAEVPGAGCTWSRTRTYTATDACGNTATCTQVFTYTRDLVAPVFTFCPPGSDLGCNPNGVPDPGTPTATDNCAGTVTFSNSLAAEVPGAGCTWSRTRTYTATDACGNTATCTQVFTYTRDLVAPVFTFCPPGSDLGCNPNGVPDPGTPTATDNCAGTVTFSNSLAAEVPGAGCTWSRTRTYTATDACGNTATCTQVFTYTRDLVAPVFTFCPPGSDLGCNPNGVPDPGTPTATDNCAGTVTFSSSLAAEVPGAGCTWSRTRTYTATDACGNTATCTQVFTYTRDLVAPVFTFCPPGSDLGCNPNGVPDPGTPTATDNCAGTVTFSNSLAAEVPGAGCTWSRTRTYTATDACGNTATCTQVFTYTRDLVAPVFTFCPPGSDLGCNPNGVPDPGTPTATDNCAGTVTFSSSLAAEVPGAGCTWSRTRTYTATDACGNTATCTQVFTYTRDLVAPVFTFCPPGSDLGCNPNGVPDPGTPTATDNCAGTVTFSNSLAAEVPGAGCTWSRTRTYTATDACGNTATCTQVFTYTRDLVAPVFTFCPPGSNLGCNPTGFPPPGNALATDNCGNVTITSVLGVPVLGQGCTWTRTRTYTATDGCGNTATCTQVFTYIVDVTPPVFTFCPPGSNLGCNPTGFPAPGNAIATDNCGTPTITSVLGNPVAGLLCPTNCNWTRTRTYTATDACGNTATCTQVFTYTVDVTPPVFTSCPHGSNLGCNPTGFPPPGNAVATDNCGTPTITSVLGAPVAGQGCSWTRTRTYTATDGCGNTTTRTQVFTYKVDVTPPVFTFCPPDQNLGCNPSSWPPGNATATDNCGTPVITSVLGNPVAGPGPGIWTRTRTYKATDDCHNTATCTQVYTYTMPLVSCCNTSYTINNGNPVFCNMVDNTLAVTINVPYSAVSWAVVAGNWIIKGPTNGLSITFDAMSTSYATFRITIYDLNGCAVTCDKTITCDDAWEHCTLTQGFYGNQNGHFCDIPGDELVTDLLNTSLILGLPGRSYTVNAGNADCVADLLPGGGTAKILATGDNGCGYGSQPHKNILFNQSLTLALNLRLDDMLSGVGLTTTFWLIADNSDDCGSVPTATAFDDMAGISASVYEYLEENYNSNPTVNDLMTLANDALGNNLTYPCPPSLSNISSAATAINEAFDECMWVEDEGGLEPQKDHPINPDGSSDKFTINLTAIPNPFTQSSTIQVKFSEDVEATIEIYSLMGIKVASLGSGKFSRNKTYDLVFTPDPALSQATYIVVVLTEKGNKQFRIIKIR